MSLYSVGGGRKHHSTTLNSGKRIHHLKKKSGTRCLRRINITVIIIVSYISQAPVHSSWPTIIKYIK